MSSKAKTEVHQNVVISCSTPRSTTRNNNMKIDKGVMGDSGPSTSSLSSAVETKKCALIEFTLDGTLYVSTCPISWIVGKNCTWPSKKGIERKAIINNMKPENYWILLENVNILGKYDRYIEAFEKEKRKSVTDGTSSDDNDVLLSKRKIRKNSKYRDDSISPPPVDAVSEDLSDDSAEHSSNELTIVDKVSHLDNTNFFDIENSITNADIEFIDTDDLANNTLVQTRVQTKNCDDIWNLLLEIKVRQELVVERLVHLEKMIACNGVVVDMGNTSDSKLPKFPFNTILEINEFEVKLKEDQLLQSCLLKYLQFIGGNNEKFCVFRCLEKIFTNYVGQFCSWTGKGGNLRLSDTVIVDIIKRAVKVSFPAITENSYEGYCRAWLNHAKTRFLRETKET